MPEMDVAEPALRYLTVGDFLAWDDGTDRRYELVQGEIVARAPVQGAHSLVAGYLAAQVSSRLKSPCRVFVEAGIYLPHRDDAFYIADVAIACGPVRPEVIGVADPVVVAEILSRSTARHDRGLKLQDYRQIPSVQEILMIAAGEPRTELWRRSAAGWDVVDLKLEHEISLESVGISFPLAALYDGITFPAAS